MASRAGMRTHCKFLQGEGARCILKLSQKALLIIMRRTGRIAYSGRKGSASRVPSLCSVRRQHDGGSPGFA
jgi:hypothetical protein